METSATAVTTPLCRRHYVGRCTSWLLWCCMLWLLTIDLFVSRNGTFAPATRLDRPDSSSAHSLRTPVHRVHLCSQVWTVTVVIQI